MLPDRAPDTVRRILRSSSVALLLLALSLAGLYGTLVFRSSREDALRSFADRSDRIAAEARFFVVSAERIAGQLPTRTQIRLRLADYIRGEASREDLVEFTTPRLADAVTAASELLGAARYDADGNRLVSVGFPETGAAGARLESTPDSGGARSLGTLATVEDREALLVVAPIEQSGLGTIGYDLVAVAIDDLAELLDGARTLLPDAAVALVARNAAGERVVRRHGSETEWERLPAGWEGTRAGPAASGAGTIDEPRLGRTRLVRSTHRVGEGLVLTVAVRTAALYADSSWELALVIGIAVGVAALAIAGNVIAHRRLGRAVADEQERLESLVRDRTVELEELLTEKNLLLRELHHRLKNDLSVVQSMLELQETSGTASFGAARSRVGAISAVYASLQEESGNAAVSLARVLGPVVTSVAGEWSSDALPVEIETSIDEIHVPGAMSVRLAIIVNELVMNAVKYAFADVRRPRIALAAHVDESTRELVVCFRDNGVGVPDEVTRQRRLGFGFTMIAAVVNQFDGTLTIANEEGTRVEVRLPESRWGPDAASGAAGRGAAGD